jgi:membrane dipeptidase
MTDMTKQDWKVSERARQLHADALVWDDHSGFEPDPSVDLEILERWRAAGVDYLSVNVGYDVVPWQQTVKNIGAFTTWLEKHPDRFTLVRRVDDILAAKHQSELGIAFDIEGMNSLDGQAYMVSFYYRLGVRQMLPGGHWGHFFETASWNPACRPALARYATPQYKASPGRAPLLAN